MTNFGGIKPSMSVINRFWNTVLILCSSAERQAILSTPLDTQDTQNCARKKPASHEGRKMYSYRCKMAAVCISEIILPNFTSAEGRTTARVLCRWRLGIPSIKVMC